METQYTFKSQLLIQEFIFIHIFFFSHSNFRIVQTASEDESFVSGKIST